MSVMFIQVEAYVRISFLFKAEQYFTVRVYTFSLSTSFIHGHVGCFHGLAILNNAVMNTDVQISFWGSAFNSFEYISRGGISGS